MLHTGHTLTALVGVNNFQSFSWLVYYPQTRSVHCHVGMNSLVGNTFADCSDLINLALCFFFPAMHGINECMSSRFFLSNGLPCVAAAHRISAIYATLVFTCASQSKDN